MWQDEIEEKLILGTNLFILWGNIGDLQKNKKGDYVPLADFLVDEFLRQRMVMFYTISGGLQFLHPETDGKIFRQKYIGGGPAPAPTTAAQKIGQGSQQNKVAEAPFDQLIGRTPETALPFLVNTLKDDIIVSELDKAMAEKITTSRGIYKKVLIISFAHNLAPTSTGTQNLPERIVVETLERLAHDPEITRTGNTVILITPNLVDLAEPLRSTQADIPDIRIPKPKVEERTRFWQGLISQNQVGLAEGIDAQVLGLNTSGLSVRQIKGIFELARSNKTTISLSLIKEEKRKILEREFGDKIKIKIPDKGFAYLGGMKKIKEYLLEVSHNIQIGMLRRVPLGILAVGPPGTGKTFAFECWAYECNCNFVEIQNIRSKYVGDTERYMQMMLGCLEDLAPVIVVEDEADQSEADRDAFNGDNGVSNRIRQKKFEFCSRPDIRGKVIWIRISNRPDLLDAAYKRKGRSDEIIPFLLPGENEYPDIFRVKFLHYDIPMEIADFSKFSSEVANKLYVTGADIEWMVLEADKISAREGSDKVREVHLYRAINDWELSLSPDDINKQTILAITGSSKSLRPDNWEKMLRVAQERMGDKYPAIMDNRSRSIPVRTHN